MDEQARKQQPLNPIKESLEGPDLALVKRLRELYQHSKYEGLSELATAVGLSTSQVSRVLSGERRPAKTFFELFFSALEGKNGRSVTEETRTDTLRLYYTCIRPHRPYEYRTFVLEQEKKKIQEELEKSQRLVDQIQGELLEARTARDNLAKDYRALEQSFTESEVAKSGALESLRDTRVRYEQARKQISEEIVELAKELRQAEKDRDDAQRRCNELQEALQKAQKEAQAAAAEAEEGANQKHLKDLQSEKERNKKLEDENRALRQRVDSILAARNWLGLGEEPKTQNKSESPSSEHEADLGVEGKGVLPVEATVTRFYGEAGNRGIDFSVPAGISVKAIMDGKVVSAGWNGPYGYEVILRHADGLHSQYAHLSTIGVKASQSVKTGQRLGKSGSTGDCMHPHLHLEVRTTAAAGTDIDPVAYLATLGIRIPRPATSPSPQAPAELLITAQIRLLRSHEESKRAAAVQELTTMIGEFPRSEEEITEALCSYIRRSPTEQENGYLEASARAALTTVLSRPRANHKPLDLTYANLSRLNLENMNMVGVLLRGANLRGARLDSANLRHAQLQSAHLTDATLNQTDLSNANLSTATGITAATLSNAIMNSETTLPSGKRWTPQAQNETLADRKRVDERPDGPWDITEVRDPAEGRVDLGGLFVPGVDGMELRVEVAGDAIVAATVVLRDSAIQLQAFAAPKREGIWGEVREEIGSGITQQGGIVDEVEGPLGWELRAQVPVQLPDGTGGFQVVRFVGVDGPRWFLRGVISGQGAVQPQAAGLLEQIFRDTVVVRGEGPMAPRDPIVLKLPNDAQEVPEEQDDGTAGDPRASA